MGILKAELAERLVETIVPIGDEIRRLLADPAHLDAVLANGADEARAIAAETVADVKCAMGM
jgi:tryptophanyl-tRNA synthetase